MGKAKRFNPYDSDVAEKRKIVQAYGQARQNVSGITSTFRNSPLPPIAVSTGAASGTGTGKFCTASLAADQTTNLNANDHVEFDTLDEDGGTVLQTGSGQADGIFELGSGTTYYLTASLRPEYSGSTGEMVIVWYDITNSAEIGSRGIYVPPNTNESTSNQPVCQAIITPASNITVEVRIISETVLTALANEYCQASLFEIALGGTGSGTGGSSGSGGVTFPITPTINDHGNVGTVTEDIDIGASTGHVHKLTLTGNPTLTFSNPPSSGTQIEFEIEFVQDATGGRTVTHPASVAETVSINTKASTTTIITYRVNDGGTTYHAIPALRGTISLSGNAATKALDNLSGVAINASLIPATDDAIDLGSSSKEWKDVYIDGTLTVDIISCSSTADFNGSTTIKFGSFLLEDTDASNDLLLRPSAMTADKTITFPNATGTVPLIDLIQTFTVAQTFSGSTNVFSGLTRFLHGKLLIQESDTTQDGLLIVANLTADRTYTFPDKTGTVAMIADVTGSPPYDDNQTIIQDEADNTKTLTFTLSSVTTGAANVLTWASGGSRTHTLSGTTGTLAQLNLAQAWSAIQTFEDGNILLESPDTTNDLLLRSSDSAGADKTITFPDVTSTVAVLGLAQTFTLAQTFSASTNLFSGLTRFEFGNLLLEDTDQSNDLLLKPANMTSDKTATFPNNTGTVAELNLAQTWSADQTFDEDVTFGSTNADIVVFTSKINSDMGIVGGKVIKSNDTTEIGFQTTNASITVGAAGTIQIPYKTGSATNAATATTDFGNKVGCYGVYLESGGTPILVVRRADGDWATLIMDIAKLT